jgi:hypothetical protein
MSASSTPVAHEGFPIALPEHYFTQCIDQVAALGALPCSLVGKLQFVPDCLEGIYGDYAPVPQLYLMVDELCPASASRGRPATPARVSVAVSFESAYEGRPEMYASYVTFYPGQPGSLQSRADWLENTYVKGMYQGRIVTDFDEQMRRFRGAVFSLHKVLNDQITFREVDGWSQGLNFYVNRLVVQGLHQVHVERVEHMSQERVINLGHNNTINAPVIIADRIENSFNALAGSNTGAEVKQLLEQLIRDVTEASKAAPSEAAEEMARDVETLTKEVTSSKPRRRWYEISIEGLKQAAVNIGEVGQPILETVGKLLPLLIAMYPGT